MKEQAGGMKSQDTRTYLRTVLFCNMEACYTMNNAGTSAFIPLA
jgi:hypothetical protein